jgi:hypothetical protein
MCHAFLPQTPGKPHILPCRNRISGINRSVELPAQLQNNFPAVMGALRAIFVAFRVA